MTEPNAGSDAGGSTKVKGWNNWLIGMKKFISNAGTDISDGMVVMAGQVQRKTAGPSFLSRGTRPASSWVSPSTRWHGMAWIIGNYLRTQLFKRKICSVLKEQD